ncbi:hypothetical protein GCM10022254_16720 [Actinomadura meridiana]|uniref:Uncharacterized protein n=1 Tax=Actinomadura meridiana TaxID=559626 RepID=A0ABP8BVT1_9ACTN
MPRGAEPGPLIDALSLGLDGTDGVWTAAWLHDHHPDLLALVRWPRPCPHGRTSPVVRRVGRRPGDNNTP